MGPSCPIHSWRYEDEALGERVGLRLEKKDGIGTMGKQCLTTRHWGMAMVLWGWDQTLMDGAIDQSLGHFSVEVRPIIRGDGILLRGLGTIHI